MKRKPGPEEGPGLFDLPLDAGAARRPAATREPGAEPGPRTGAAAEPPALFAPEAEPVVDGAPSEEDPAAGGPAATPLRSRYGAGLFDLAVTLAVALSMAVGLRGMGVELAWDDAPAVAVFLLAFSYLYLVTPLAFWGRTPGMAWAGLVARDAEGGPLTFRQTTIRWLGALVTTLALGLPLLLALSGGSLSDRLSGSRTYRRR